MKRSQLAVQLFTVRDFLKTPVDIAVSLAKISKIGYQAIQVSGMGEIEESELVRIADDNGLTICATHENGKRICENTAEVIERLHKLNCSYTAYPHPHVTLDSASTVRDLAVQINAAAEMMAKEGISLSYHNHAIEFGRFDGELALDMIYKNAPALTPEIDTYWIASGGQDPAKWIRRFPGRQPLLHLKEYGIVGSERKMLAIGKGNLDWQDIIAAGTECAVKYFIVEQDDCNGVDPFDELRASYDFIAENFFD